MLSIFIRICVFIGFVFETSSLRYRNQTCGIDKTKTSVVYEGIANIEDYPWMGTLFYPIRKGRMTTSVVLVSKQIVIGSAREIDTLPKYDVRSRSRVVLGSKCSGPSIKIRDYALHPDYRDYPDSTLAMVQLEVDLVLLELRPICSPPAYFIEPEFYAMVAGDCNKGKMRIFKMNYVPQEECQHFYRKFGLDNDKFWPKHTTCARAVSPAVCRWRSGAALVIKQDGRWKLLGLGLDGPGCRSPARFLDYGLQQAWVRDSVTRIGLPAITRVGDGHLIMRRSLGNLQRFGYCDAEERRHLLYSDRIDIVGTSIASKASYNLTLYSNTEYSCITLRAKALEESSEHSDSSEEMSTTTTTTTKRTTTARVFYSFDFDSDYIDWAPTTTTTSTTTSTTTQIPPPATKRPCKGNPQLHLRRWCADSAKMCYGFQFVEIDFYVDILFYSSTVFTISAYGKQAKVIDPVKALKYSNNLVSPILVSQIPYKELLRKLNDSKYKPRTHQWFYL